MLVVSNTPPISNLATIGLLDLIRIQCEEVWIPEAVERELATYRHSTASASIKEAIADGWIRPIKVSPSSSLNMLSRLLHEGEAQAICLAIERRADLVIIDEREARKLATQSGLTLTGVLGILLRAKLAKQIDEVYPQILLLRREAGFFISEKLKAQILALAGE